MYLSQIRHKYHQSLILCVVTDKMLLWKHHWEFHRQGFSSDFFMFIIYKNLAVLAPWDQMLLSISFFS